MSVAQTSQLIQLILNSALMITAVVLLLGVLLIRQTWLQHQIHTYQLRYQQGLEAAATADHWVQDWSHRLQMLRQQILQLRYRYRIASQTIGVIQVATLGFTSSTLLLGSRSFLGWNWLVSTSLGLFVAGVVALLLGLALLLVDLYAAGRAFDRWPQRSYSHPFPALPTELTAQPSAQIPVAPPKSTAASFSRSPY